MSKTTFINLKIADKAGEAIQWLDCVFGYGSKNSIDFIKMLPYIGGFRSGMNGKWMFIEVLYNNRWISIFSLTWKKIKSFY